MSPIAALGGGEMLRMKCNYGEWPCVFVRLSPEKVAAKHP